MRLPQLDERLLKAAKFFPACGYGADIGADHGRLSCFLLAHNRCKRMCVSDLSAPSLEKAKRLIAMHRMEDRADFCVGDGLQALPQQADAIAVLGMGGKTIAHILKEGREKLHGAALILSAHTELSVLRSAIAEVGYAILDEDIAYAGGRFYVIIKAECGSAHYTEKELQFGPVLMKKRPEHFRAYMKWRRDVLSCENSEKGRVLLQMAEEEMDHDESDRS